MRLTYVAGVSLTAPARADPTQHRTGRHSHRERSQPGTRHQAHNAERFADEMAAAPEIAARLQLRAKWRIASNPHDMHNSHPYSGLEVSPKEPCRLVILPKVTGCSQRRRKAYPVDGKLRCVAACKGQFSRAAYSSIHVYPQPALTT